MKKIITTEIASEKALKARKFVKGLSANILALSIAMGVSTSAKSYMPEQIEIVNVPTNTVSNTGTPMFVHVKQPEIIDNYYYQFGHNDVNSDGYVDTGEITTDVQWVANTEVVNPQENANLYALSTEMNIHGWVNLGVYDPAVIGEINSAVGDVVDKINAMHTNDDVFYILKKLPDITKDEDGKEVVRTYYFLDGGDGIVNRWEIRFHDEEITYDPYGNPIIFGQHTISTLKVKSDTMFVPGYQVVGIVGRNQEFATVDDVNRYIEEAILKDHYELNDTKRDELILKLTK